MRVLRLHPEHPEDYCCNVYWLLGDSNHAGDRNTLVDAGSSRPENLDFFCREMSTLSKGIGKAAVEQVVITHAHYDHIGGLAALAGHFRPSVYGYRVEPGIDHGLYDGQWLHLGDLDFRVLHTPGHSEDSICLYCPVTGELFSGDTLYRITDTGGAYPKCYLESLERIRELEISTIFPGHGEPITQGTRAFINGVLENVRRSSIS